MADGGTQNGDDFELVGDADYKARVAQLEQQMAEIQQKEEEMAAQMQEECKAEMDARLRNLEDQLKTSFTSVSTLVFNPYADILASQLLHPLPEQQKGRPFILIILGAE